MMIQLFNPWKHNLETGRVGTYTLLSPGRM